jgi:hypothetical protein
MATGFQQRVFDAPLHVSTREDGAVRVYFPDGTSILLSLDAAARSVGMLSRAVSGHRDRHRRSGDAPANVIPADFAGRTRAH